jgi:hypothetical protein
MAITHILVNSNSANEGIVTNEEHKNQNNLHCGKRLILILAICGLLAFCICSLGLIIVYILLSVLTNNTSSLTTAGLNVTTATTVSTTTTTNSVTITTTTNGVLTTTATTTTTTTTTAAAISYDCNVTTLSNYSCIYQS